ncbi:hypothetical protein [Nocardioides okcheonensis]|uniref:hypothetical protein n=1 Tax=Nocardioides okcheonensis TaxID=2894081 RepID=UPI001E4E4284|nr:hypothetical protein [Nocardioides okcheonensis]UFN44115.1 hypothetical protein LN652_19020 [Nocardioides okcheonensis]
MSPADRLRRVVAASGLGDVVALEAAVDSLAVAVAENAALEVPLAALVDDLERDVAEVVARRAGDGMGA